MGVKLGLASY